MAFVAYQANKSLIYLTTKQDVELTELKLGLISSEGIVYERIGEVTQSYGPKEWKTEVRPYKPGRKSS